MTNDHLQPFQPWTSERYSGHIQKPKPAPKQTPTTIYSIFPNIDKWALGYDSMFDALEKMAVSKSAGYPPYNIHKLNDEYTIEMALAGFRKDDIDITVKDRTLTVKSDIEDRNAVPEEGSYGQVLHHGIAQRNFTQTFALGEYVVVKNAKLEDGLLTINLALELPDEKKPRHIDIN